jgi:hypothetical protein
MEVGVLDALMTQRSQVQSCPRYQPKLIQHRWDAASVARATVVALLHFCACTGFAPTAPGVDHASCGPTSVRGFEERTQALGEHGLDPQSPPGSGRVYFKDPDGVILQLS